MTEVAARAALVAEARSWLGTPFHHQGRIKGSGVDCAMLLQEVYEKVGLVRNLDTPDYVDGFSRNGGGDQYLAHVLDRLNEVGSPKPGDVVLFKIGAYYAHGGIVVEWPLFVHASKRGVELGNVEQDGMFATRARRFFSFWGEQ